MSGEPLSDFEEGQWWILELDKMAQSINSTLDQKRAVAVVHNLLGAVSRVVNGDEKLSLLDERDEKMKFMSAMQKLDFNIELDEYNDFVSESMNAAWVGWRAKAGL